MVGGNRRRSVLNKSLSNIDMVTILKLFKLLSVGLIFLLSSFLITDLAYARGGGGGGGGCFASGTSILTVRGNLPIEQLHQGDLIISYNFKSNQTEVSKIGNIQLVNSEKYLLINGNLKVTETHPFYLKTSTDIKIESAQKLKVGDRLIGKDNTDLVISSIDRINKNIVVYNLLSIEPNHNFYANSILVHNKGGGGGGSGGYHIWSGGGANSALNQKTFPEFILVAIIIIACLLPLALFNEIVNSILFYNKFFSDNSDLIEYTKNINSNFNNRYSVKYLRYDQPSELISIESEIAEQDYQHLCSKLELSAQLRDLFVQYQLDWMNKDFDRMVDYIAEPFYSEQKRRCENYFAKSCDVVYKPELIELAPISLTEADNQHIFLMQLNAQIINFVISTKGTVLRGHPTPYCFTEYWQIGVDTAGKWSLINISQDKE
jgi:hypothetical protein